MTDTILEQLKDKLLELDMDGTLEVARSVVQRGEEAIAKEAIGAVSDGLEVVGKRFQEGEWFLTELIYAGEIAKEAMSLLTPVLESGSADSKGTVVVGTVAHDLHDLGKDIFVSFAKGAGFRVVDLGVDVSTEQFMAALKEHSPFVLGMSCLLTATTGELGKVIELPEKDVQHKVSEQFLRELKTKDVIVSTVGSGDIFGWSGLIPPYRATAGAKAVTDCSVVAVQIQELRDLLEEDCAFGLALTLKAAQIIRERLRDLRTETLSFIVQIRSSAIPHSGRIFVKLASHVRNIAFTMAREPGRLILGKGTPEI